MTERRIECGYPAMRHYLKLWKESEDKAFAHFNNDCYKRMDKEIRAQIDGLDFGTYCGAQDWSEKRAGDYLELYCCLHFLRYREEFPATLEEAEEIYRERRRLFEDQIKERNKRIPFGISSPSEPSSSPTFLPAENKAIKGLKKIVDKANKPKIKPAKIRKW